MTFPEVADPRSWPVEMSGSVKLYILNINYFFLVCIIKYVFSQDDVDLSNLWVFLFVLFYFDGDKFFMCLDLLECYCMFSTFVILGKTFQRGTPILLNNPLFFS